MKQAFDKDAPDMGQDRESMLAYLTTVSEHLSQFWPKQGYIIMSIGERMGDWPRSIANVGPDVIKTVCARMVLTTPQEREDPVAQ